MNKSIFSILLVMFIIPFMIFAAEKPQVVTNKPVLPLKQKTETYNPVKQFQDFKGVYGKSSNPTSEDISLNEGFENLTFPPTGWHTKNILGGVQWMRASSIVHSGTGSAIIAWEVAGGEDWLVTPQLTIEAGDSLTFWTRKFWDAIYPPDTLEIRLSTTDTSVASFTTILAVYDVNTFTNPNFGEYKIDLNAFAGQNVYIAFRHYDTNGNGMYLDDVVVGTAPMDPVMNTLYSELNAPPTAVGDTATTQTDEIALLVNSGGTDLTISSITLDNPDFSFTTTTSLVAPGDTLFGTASFQPSVSGLITGTMIISGDDPANPSDTVLVSGVGYPASYALEEFDNWVFTPVYFSRIDNNNDGTEWGWFLLTSGGDTNFVAGMVYTAAGNDDYLVTPAFEVQSGDFISFESWVQGASYPETWEVLVSTTDNLATSFTIGLDTVTSNSLDPVNYVYDLSAFAGNTIYVAIRNVSVDMYYQWVDNIIMPAPVGIVKLNEVYYDSPGADTHTFTELFGTPGMNLDGFSLEGVNGNGGTTTDIIDLTGNSVPADGFFVIGQDAGVDNVDLIDSDVDFQNGPDNVVLINGADTVDALGYGDFSSAVFVGEGNPAEDVFSGVSLNRYPDGDDTDDNATDFLGAYPTPGIFNNAPHPIIGGGSSVGFGSVMIGNDSTRNYNIYNNGSADLVVSTIVFSNPDFTTDWSDSTIAPGASAGLAVTFTPTDTVVYADSMIIVNNDPLNAARAVSLSGIGYGTPVVNPPDDDNEYAFRSSPNGGVFRVDDDAALDVIGDFTVEAWVYIDEDNTSSRFIASRPDVWEIYINSASVRFDLLPAAGVISTGILSLNEWHHVAVVGQGTDQKIYADGELKASSTILALTAGTTPVVIGGRDTWFSSSPTSIIDEVKFSNAAIYDTAGFTPLTTAPLGFDANTVFYFQFEDTTAVPPLDNGPLRLSISNGQSDGTNLFEAGNYVEAPAGLPLHPPGATVVFEDDFESGTTQWTLEGTWGLTTLQAYSPTHSLTESPVGNYVANLNISATMVTGVDLSGADVKGANLSFMGMGNIESGNFDYMYVEASNDGTNWSTLDAIFGEPISPIFISFDYSLGAFIGDNDVKVRFRFYSDGGYEVDGMYIDDFMITTSAVDTVAPVIVHDGPDFYEGVTGDFGREAEIIDVSGVTNAEISYSVEGGSAQVIGPDSSSGDMYYYTLPAQSPGSNVEYEISAEDGEGNVGTYPEIFKYISGTHLFYANPEVTYIRTMNTGTGLAVRFSVPAGEEAQLVTGLIRNYTDQSQPPNGQILVHVWDDNAGLPGNDIITPFLVRPEANLLETSRMTRVDLRAYAAQLSNMTGDFHIGFTVPDTAVIHTYHVPTTAAGRSSVFTGTWAADNANDYHVRAVVVLDTLTSILGDDLLPAEFALRQNYPNPFNPSTTIKYALKTNADVKLTIYNILGQEVRTLINNNMAAGYKEVVWNGLDNHGRQVATGVYIYRIEAGDFVKSHKMIFMK